MIPSGSAIRTHRQQPSSKHINIRTFTLPSALFVPRLERWLRISWYSVTCIGCWWLSTNTWELYAIAFRNGHVQRTDHALPATTTAIPLFSMIMPWIRKGLDPSVNYGAVSGQRDPLVKDHFIELQFIRNFMMNYTGALSIDAFNTIVGTILSCSRRFSLHNLGSIRQLNI